MGSYLIGNEAFRKFVALPGLKRDLSSRDIIKKYGSLPEGESIDTVRAEINQYMPEGFSQKFNQVASDQTQAKANQEQGDERPPWTWQDEVISSWVRSKFLLGYGTVTPMAIREEKRVLLKLYFGRAFKQQIDEIGEIFSSEDEIPVVYDDLS